MSSVIIIGGGIIGAGIARDLSLRGLDVTLLEREAPAAGATGRCHGLLHSGTRYAVKDSVSAAECAKENMVLKNIAPESIEDTGGQFLAITEDDAAYGDILLRECKKCAIPVEERPPSESPNRGALRCFSTNDARIDPFILVLSNLYDAYINGAKIWIGKGVKSISDDHVVLENGESLRADLVINATGHEGDRLLKNITASRIQPNKGTLLVTERRVSDVILNRMRPPSNGDIIVPCHTTSIIGTTSSNSSSNKPLREEYKELMKEASILLPSIKDVRIIRAFSGVRPLIGAGDGRELSRDYHIFTDGQTVTVAGGKLTTYRLISEKVSDLVMKMLGERGECRTKSPLPEILGREQCGEVLCNCESAQNKLIGMEFLKGIDISKYNRIGFGACQGMRCSKSALRPESFLQERWKGVKPVISDGQFQQAYISWASYMSRMGRI
jgi:glycerol-3-phosphate dehydrogenase